MRYWPGRRRRGGPAAPFSGRVPEERRQRAHWRATRVLAATVVSAAALLALVLTPVLGEAGLPVFGLPLWRFLMSLAVPVFFVLLAFAFCASQHTIDRMFRVAETD